MLVCVNRESCHMPRSVGINRKRATQVHDELTRMWMAQVGYSQTWTCVSKSPVSLLAQAFCKVREDEEQVLLVVLDWPKLTWFLELVLLETAPPSPIHLRKDLLF